MTRLAATASGIYVPSNPEDLKAVCPAASITRFADTGRPAIMCAVEGGAFAVEDSPVAALGWCCGGYTDCPVWVAEKEHDPALGRMRAAKERAAANALTTRQIASGARVDDRGLFADFAQAAVQGIVNDDPERFRALAAEGHGLVEIDP